MGCYNSTVVSAPAEEVWQAFRDFHDLSWAAGVVTSVEAVGSISGDSVGAKRVLNGAFHETLIALDDESRTLEYSIDDGPEAVSKDNVQGYVGKVRVLPVTADGSTFVEWTSSWASDGGGVAEFCDPIYRAFLNDLKQHFS